MMIVAQKEEPMTIYDDKATGARATRDGGLLELKADAGDGVWRLEGLASTWELDAQGDEVQPGAFLESLGRAPNPPLLWAHDQAKVIGRAEVLRETPQGLWGRWRLSKTRDAADARQLMLDKCVDGLSIGFQVRPTDVEFRAGVRRLKSITLHEISVVALPAAHGARIASVKSLAGGARPSHLARFLERQARRTDLAAQRHQLQYLRLRLPILTATGGR
jgi:HK97 family phage prohead protease